MIRIKSILQRAIHELGIVSDTPELDARVLLEAAIDQKTDYIFSHPEAPMFNADYAQFRRYIRRRKKGEPVAYILGHKEFFGLDFHINKNVLIPRPETELLVEEALEFLNKVISTHPAPLLTKSGAGGERSSMLCSIPDEAEDLSRVCPRDFSPRLVGARNDSFTSFRILDVGTGSGNIITSLAHGIKTLPCSSRTSTKWYSFERVKLYGVDVSSKALSVARKNARRHGLEKNIKFFNSDLFSNKRLPKKFDLIIANLPYVPLYDQTPGVYDQNAISFEPQSAIFAENNGTSIIKRFLEQTKDRINAGGMILVELDLRNATELLSYAKKTFPRTTIELKKDLAGLDRYLKIST